MRTAVVIGLLVLSSAGLAVLGISASDAAESRALLRAREVLDGVARTLAGVTAGILVDADGQADRWDPEAAVGDLLSDVFVIASDGRIRHPPVESFPALPPPNQEETERVRAYFGEADGVAGEVAERLLETAAFEEFTHPDLVGALLLELADLSRKAGNVERAAYRYRSIVRDLPAARNRAGTAIAPEAYLRLLAMLADDGKSTDEDARVFAMRLADRAWSLPDVERELLLERAAQRLSGGSLPPDVVRRRDFVDAFGPGIRGMATAESGAGGEWQHVTIRAGKSLDVFGWRDLTIEGARHVFGYRASRDKFRGQLGQAAVELAVRHDMRIEIGLVPPLVAGDFPEGDPLAREVNLPGRLAAAVAIAPPEGLGLLRTLHVTMTLLLTASLLTGVLLSVRAVRREVRTAKLRQNLLDNTSHELRTPLTTIRMYAEMLAEEDLPEDKATEYRGVILSESERLSLLVDEVLDLSRLTSEETTLAVGPVIPREIAAAAVTRLALPGEAPPIRLTVPEGLPRVLADRDAAIRALANLLSNARKYSEGEIGVDGIAMAGVVRLEVWDRGPGIPPGDREQLFTRFYRSPRNARKVKGVGIGLVLAREIARAQGGDVMLVDSSEEGSRFALCLPVATEEKP